VGSVLGLKFGKDVPDLALHCVLAGRELRRDLLVGIPLGNQTQDTDFRRGQRIVGGMFGELEGDLGGHGFFSGLDGSNGDEQLLVQAVLEQICPRACLKCPQRLYVPSICCQNDYARLGKLTANRDDRIESVHLRHL
jgi:hypothetical protein